MRTGKALAGVELGSFVSLHVVAQVVKYLLCRRGRILDRGHGHILYPELFVSAGKFAVNWRCLLGKARGEGCAIADKLRRGAAHSVGKLVERIQKRGFFAPVLQNARFALVEFVKLRKILGVARPDLAYGVIHQPSSRRRTLLYEVEIVRAEQHDIKCFAELRGRFFHGIDRYLLPDSVSEQYSHGLLALVAFDLGQDLRAVAAEADELPVKARAEAAPHCEHVHGL